MPYICSNPKDYLGQEVGTGHCVPFVKQCSGAPKTSKWRQGLKVRGNKKIKKGTAIATFVNGKYANKRTGNHAAIYISQDSGRIWVYDQWKGRTVHKRPIRFKGKGKPSNDGDAFYVIE